MKSMSWTKKTKAAFAKNIDRYCGVIMYFFL